MLIGPCLPSTTRQPKEVTLHRAAGDGKVLLHLHQAASNRQCRVQVDCGKVVCSWKVNG